MSGPKPIFEIDDASPIHLHAFSAQEFPLYLEAAPRRKRYGAVAPDDAPPGESFFFGERGQYAGDLSRALGALPVAGERGKSSVATHAACGDGFDDAEQPFGLSLSHEAHYSRCGGAAHTSSAHIQRTRRIGDAARARCGAHSFGAARPLADLPAAPVRLRRF